MIQKNKINPMSNTITNLYNKYLNIAMIEVGKSMFTSVSHDSIINKICDDTGLDKNTVHGIIKSV